MNYSNAQAGSDYNHLAGQQLKQYAGDVPNAVPVSPLDRLLSAISSLEQATSSVVNTTDALCGSQPVGNEKSAADPAPSGLFAAINLSGNRIERMAQTITDCMNRIHRVAG